MPDYTFVIKWSKDDNEYVGTCLEFPSLSHLAKTWGEALQGIKELVEVVAKDLQGETMKPTLWQKVTIYLLGSAKSRKLQPDGCPTPIQYYLAKCKRHGYFEDYEHGFDASLYCPKCTIEWKAKYPSS